jgi:molecular chaperone DnaK (HSP70)
MRPLGIDFGTSNTVAMLRAPDGRARPALFDGSPLLPSAVHVGADGGTLVGRDAERAGRADPAGFEPNPKRRVDDGRVLLAGREIAVPTLIAAVLARVAAEAVRQVGPALDLRMTYPAGWGERRRAVLLEAVRRAGLPAPRLVAEPVAAAAYYTAVLGSTVPVGRALAIYDLGGGTFDAAVVRRTVTGFEVLADGGLSTVGGLDFDQAVVEHLARTHFAVARATYGDPGGEAGWRLRALLYDEVRAAKETLSRAARADVRVPELDLRAHLTRDELERLVRPYLLRTVRCLAATIAAARLAPAELAGIFLVGGSSRIPLAAHLVHTELGVVPTTLEQPETVVAEGSLYLGGAADVPSRHGPHSGVPRTTVAIPSPAPVPAQPPVPAPEPVPAPARSRSVQPPVAARPWYAEPVILATVLAAILVAVAAVVLIKLASQ